MAVLTRKEYEKRNSSLQKKEEGYFPLQFPIEKPEEKIIGENIVYVLLHPENGTSDFLNFKDFVMIDNIKYFRECKNGIVKTKDIPLKNFLTGKGYLLLDENHA